MSESAEPRRRLGLGSASALVVSNMIGTGIFVSTPFFAGDLGSVPLVLAIWLAGAVVSLAGAVCYAELGVNYPDSGGEYVYLRESFGPIWAFMSGWTSFFVGFSCAIAAAALAFARYLGYFSQALVDNTPYFVWGPEAFRISPGPQEALACLLIAGMTAINFLDLDAVARFQNWSTSFKVATLVLLIGGGFLLGQGDWGNFALTAARSSERDIWAQFAVSLCFVYTSYSGWNAATYIAGELHNPAKTLPRALAFGTLLVALLYLLLNLVFVFAMPLEAMKSEQKLAAAVAAKLFGGNIGGAFAAAMAAALLSTVNAMVTVGPRVYYAMAKNKAFFSWVGQLSPRTGTPLNAVLIQGVVAMVITLTPLPTLVFFIGFTLNLFTVLTVGSLFLFRRREGWQKLGVVSFAWPVIPVFYIVVGLWVTAFGLYNEPVKSSVALGLIALGAVAYRSRLTTAARPVVLPQLGR
jgi:APA family basic amino acid/polyamine antiporter